MAEGTNEVIYEVLKQLQSEIAEREQGQRETNAHLNALTAHMAGLQQDISNISATLTRHGARVERIERRLGLSEVPA